MTHKPTIARGSGWKAIFGSSRAHPALYLCSIMLLSVTGCTGNGDQDAGNTSQYASVSGEATYVGIDACKTCHAPVYDTYKDAEMGRSFRKAALSTSDADFEIADAVFDSTADLYYQAFHRSDELFLREFRLNGRDTTHNRVEKIDFIVGSGQHTNSHIYEENGFLYQMPLTWYSQDGKWDLPPKYRQVNYRFSRPIPLACMTCHNAVSGFRPESENRYDHVPLGIDCEKCHGPGSKHIENIEAGIIVDVESGIDYSIVNPAKLPVDRQFDICQGCHMQGASVYKEGKNAADFRPGMALEDVQNVFWPRSADSVETFIMASHPDRLRMSECFRSSNESDSAVEPLTCITCHNPHVSIATLGDDYYNETCQSCHTDPAIAECTESPEVRMAAGNNCVQCHMPVSGSSDIPHVRITDHFIRPLRVGEDRAVTAGQVEEGRRTYSLASLIDDNPTDAEIADGFLTYYEEKTNQPGFIDSAKVYLRKAESAGHSRQSLARIWIRAWFWEQDYSSIKGMANQVTLGGIEDPWTHYRIGEAYLSTGLPDESVTHFSRAVELAPEHLRFLNKLAVGQSESGDHAAALGTYDRLLTLNPKFEGAYNNRGFARLVLGDVAGAESDFKQSLALYPDGENSLANLASLYYNTNRPDSALIMVDRLIRIDPSNSDYVEFRMIISGGGQ
ncbi:MAG: tetratricopeptide repeat protein [Rhodothermales bacterium]|nr:tetratricopeptide repeat protein [Rhodothermales bacterium]